jgi:tetratricopeptide (TPR) repeat protein
MLAMYLIIAAGVAISLLVLLWFFWLSPGARRGRRLAAAQSLLGQNKWREALSMAAPFQDRRLAPRWQKLAGDVLAAAHESGGRQFLGEKEFEKAHEQFQKAAEARGQQRDVGRVEVVAAMLDEVRRLFAQDTNGGTDLVQGLIGRTLLIDSNCAEASFWQALCFIRQKQEAEAVAVLTRLADGVASNPAERFIDPPLYLGALLLRQGLPREALRYLTEANRIDGNCPVVVCLLGMAMIAGEGDVSFALRALQRPLGPRGFATWAEAPDKIWLEGFSNGRSYVRRLAVNYPYLCPLFGRGAQMLQRQGSAALAEGHYRLGQFEQSVAVYEKLAQERAPSAIVLRGLGLALARLSRFDQAFIHLRKAHELEEPKNHLTAGYLALCAARGKPATPHDRANNAAWAVWLLRNFQAPGDAEWIGLLNSIFAEARAAGVPLDAEDQLHLCVHLLSINATDAQAAEAYHELARSQPDSMRPVFAWLYCRASQLHGHQGSGTLELFARTFANREAATQFYAEQGWDFGELEFVFLERAAASEPGRFPEVLGPEYAPRGEALLLERANRFEQAGDMTAAIAALNVLVGLSPGNMAPYDQLARLQFRTGNVDTAVETLRRCHELQPESAVPLVRRAILHQQQGVHGEAVQCLHQALALAGNSEKAEIAFLGARLTLAQMFSAAANNGTDFAQLNDPDQESDIQRQCLEFLDRCLQANPTHSQANWCKAAVLCLAGDDNALSAHAADMNDTMASDPRYHYLAALCQLAAGDHGAVAAASTRASAEPALRAECEHVLAWDALDRQEVVEAAGHLERVIESNGFAAAQACALLGGIYFYQGDFARAVENWVALDGGLRARWNLQSPLANIVLLAALQALSEQDYETAAARVREAGKLGVRDRRLGPVLMLALFKAGQKLLYENY